MARSPTLQDVLAESAFPTIRLMTGPRHAPALERVVAVKTAGVRRRGDEQVVLARTASPQDAVLVRLARVPHDSSIVAVVLKGQYVGQVVPEDAQLLAERMKAADLEQVMAATVLTKRVVYDRRSRRILHTAWNLEVAVDEVVQPRRPSSRAMTALRSFVMGAGVVWMLFALHVLR